jgi:hypothetical protein
MGEHEILVNLFACVSNHPPTCACSLTHYHCWFISPQSLFLSFGRNRLRPSHFLVWNCLRRVCARDLESSRCVHLEKGGGDHPQGVQTQTGKQLKWRAHTHNCSVSAYAHRPPFYRLPPCMTPFSPLLGCAAESHTCCACVLCLLLCLALWLCGSLCTSVPRLSSPHRMSEPPTYVCVLSSTPIGWPPGITLRHLYELAVYGFYRFVVVSWPSHHFLALSDDNRR